MATYGDRYGAGPVFKPGSMALALGLTVAPIAALVMGLQIKHIIPTTTIIEAYPVPPDQPPPPPDPKPQPKSAPVPNEIVYTPPLTPPPVLPINTTPTTSDPTPLAPGPVIGTNPDPTPAVMPTPVAKPVIVGAIVDPRYQGLLQPPYPPEEQRAGNSGRVQLRVLIGTDGRVKQVEKVFAASDAFFAAAERQALNKWRFKPATQDGTPIEQWKTMTLRFEINDQ